MSLTSTDDDVRRSIDVLDQILSEFDDGLDLGVKNSGSKTPPNEEEPPPPIDRSLKPKNETPPPNLPQKNRNKIVRNVEIPEKIKHSSIPGSEKSCSSHDYQEINSDLCSSPKRDPKPRKMEGFETPLRKSRSGEVRVSSKGRKPIQKRGRSSDRHPGLDPRRRSESGCDPRFIDPRFGFNQCDPRDPRFYGPQDPRFRDPRTSLDPRLLVDSRLGPFMDDFPIERRLPPMEGPRFPHLMTLPQPSVPPPQFRPPQVPINFQGGYEYDPMLLPQGVDYPFIPDYPPWDQHYPDPMYPGPCPLDYPVNYPIDYPYPVGYPQDLTPMSYPPRGMDEQGFPYREYGHPLHRGWLPPTPDEAREEIHNIVRKQREDNFENEKRHQKSKNHDIIQKENPNNSSPRFVKSSSDESSGRSSPHDETRTKLDSRAHRGHRGYRSLDPRSQSEEGRFKVGEAVRRDGKALREFGGKETVSLPRFISAGKDSGFDESPVLEDVVRATPSSTPAGGAFVVAGVFSDSSKMYIPAPPSPTPDYNGEQALSDAESDIPQEPFYISQKSKQIAVSTRESLSEDNLQGKEVVKREKEKKNTKGGTLQAMMAQFEKGLPAVPREEGRFSDDSLEDGFSTRLSPERTKHDMIESMESLISMDGSTASFDYVTDVRQTNLVDKRHSKELSPKNETKSRLNQKEMKDKRVVVRRQMSENSCERNQMAEPKAARRQSFSPQLKEEDQNDVPKFENIKTLIQEGLIEGLDDTPPSFIPPTLPPSKLTRSSSAIEDRADSGISSTVSTNQRLDERNDSELSLADTQNKSLERSLNNGKNTNENLNLRRPTSSPPPLPPPRESSIHISRNSPDVNQHLMRNQSWLHKSKRLQPSNQSIPSNYNVNEVKDLLSHLDRSINSSPYTKVDNLNEIAQMRRNNANISRLPTDISNQYATPHDYQKNEICESYRETNLPCSRRSKTSHDDQTSLSSHGSRSSRFFSRLSESMKSSGRNSNANLKPSNARSSKKSNTKYQQQSSHVDFIRVPLTNRATHYLGTPPDFADVVNDIVLSRDGSGRFRSIEDLADNAVFAGKSLELRRDDNRKRGKKNSTLPPNLTPADMMAENHKIIHHVPTQPKIKEEPDGSKFKFNIFKGLWRRSKYSFEKT